MTIPPQHPQSSGPGQQPYVAPPGSSHQPEKKNSWSGCLIGCLVVFGLCCVLCTGVGFYAYSNFSTWVTSAARQAVKAMLEDSDLPPQEQTDILAQFDRVADAYKDGQLTLQELGEAMQDLVESPLFGVVMLQAVETKYLDPSGLSEEEKSEAKRTIMRVVRGTIEERFSQQELETLTNQFLSNPQRTPDEQPRLKPSLTDEELRSLLADAKDLVDSKEIPDEDYEVKISKVVQDIVDDVLSEK